MKKIVPLLGIITLTSITYGAGLEPRPRLEYSQVLSLQTAHVSGADDTWDALQYEAVAAKTLIQSRGTKRKREKSSHQCPEPWCGKTFPRPQGLKIHMLTHTGERPHKCPQCNQRFMSNINLRKHLRVHTGEKPYTCTLCEKGFAQKGGLKRHLTGRHFFSKSQLKAYFEIAAQMERFQCPQCNNSYVLKTYLANHIRNKHPKKIIGFLPPTEPAQAPEEQFSLDLDAPLSAVSPVTLAALMPAASKEFDEILDRPLFSLSEESLPPLSVLILPLSENR